MAAGLLVLRRGLTPFRRLRERLTALRTGEDRRIDGSYPSEVQPLIDNLNALLEDREKAVQRAVATAGDLAHGLKTPLALLAQEAERAGAAGNPGTGGEHQPTSGAHVPPGELIIWRAPAPPPPEPPAQLAARWRRAPMPWYARY